MSLKESVARLKATNEEPDFYWWKWEDAQHFLGAALRAGPGSHFRAYPGRSADGRRDLHLVIHHPDGRVQGATPETTDAGEDGFDFVFVCPPYCPE